MRILICLVLILAATLLPEAQSGTVQEATVRGQIVSTDDPPVGIPRVRVTLEGAGVRLRRSSCPMNAASSNSRRPGPHR